MADAKPILTSRTFWANIVAALALLAPVVFTQLEVVDADTQATITLEVEPATSIEGKVVDAEGKPFAKARVGALRWGNFTMQPATSTDDEGKFAIGGLTGGSYLVFAVREDIGQKDMQNIEAGTNSATRMPGQCSASR